MDDAAFPEEAFASPADAVSAGPDLADPYQLEAQLDHAANTASHAAYAKVPEDTHDATHPGAQGPGDPADQRAAPRFTLLIRAAKLVSPNGEFVCVIRDVSETGVSVRLFHALPAGSPLELHMPGGGVYEINRVWERDNEAGFTFAHSIEVPRLINEAGEYPKRGLRLGVCFPIRVSTLTQSCEGLIVNMSQQGARFECDGLFAIDQNLRIETTEPVPEFSGLRAKVRWRRDHDYGVVFDDTFTLGNFARLAARLQSPGLLLD